MCCAMCCAMCCVMCCVMYCVMCCVMCVVYIVVVLLQIVVLCCYCCLLDMLTSNRMGRGKFNDVMQVLRHHRLTNKNFIITYIVFDNPSPNFHKFGISVKFEERYRCVMEHVQQPFVVVAKRVLCIDKKRIIQSFTHAHIPTTYTLPLTAILSPTRSLCLANSLSLSLANSLSLSLSTPRARALYLSPSRSLSLAHPLSPPLPLSLPRPLTLSHSLSHLQPLDYIDAKRELHMVMSEGGEGVILRVPNSVYQNGRSHYVIKYKVFTITSSHITKLHTISHICQHINNTTLIIHYVNITVALTTTHKQLLTYEHRQDETTKQLLQES